MLRIRPSGAHDQPPSAPRGWDWPRLAARTGTGALLLAAVAFGQPTVVPSATPSPTPCQAFEETRLEFSVILDPPLPRAGDDVTLTFTVRNTSRGLAGIPEYALITAAPLLDRPLLATAIGGTQLGNETVTFRTRAVEAGVTNVRLSVHFETALGCVGEFPVFYFRSVSSPDFPVQIAAPGSARTDDYLGS